MPEIPQQIKDFIQEFETVNQFQLPSELKEAFVYSDLIHLNQTNDIKNQEFNHISFIGKYSELLADNEIKLKIKNECVEDKLNFIYLNKNIEGNDFQPVHTPFRFPFKYMENLDDVYNGMIKYKDYYVLLNTSNKDLELNVYAYTKNKIQDIDYIFLVSIGKIINPLPYTEEQVLNFQSKYNLNLSNELKNYLTKSMKTFGLQMNDSKKIYYINLEGNLETTLSKSFDRTDKLKYDLENYRKPLMAFWEKTILNEMTNEEVLNDESYKNIKKEVKEKADNFLNGFMKIGVIENERYKFSELNQDLVIELYLLLNVNDDELKDTIWVYQLADPGNSNSNDIHYLPIRKMINIGKIYNINNGKKDQTILSQQTISPQ